MTDRKQVLANDWKEIAAKAWSLRLALLAAGLSALEVVLPLWGGVVTPGAFAAASSLVAVGAGVARLLHQANMEKKDA